MNPEFFVINRRDLVMILCAVIRNKSDHFLTLYKDMSKRVLNAGPIIVIRKCRTCSAIYKESPESKIIPDYSMEMWERHLEKRTILLIIKDGIYS